MKDIKEIANNYKHDPGYKERKKQFKNLSIDELKKIPEDIRQECFFRSIDYDDHDILQNLLS